MRTSRRPGELDALLEAATTAYRERDTSGRIDPSPQWADLTPEQRDVLYERQLLSRALERALHPRQLSSTAGAVLGRAASLPQLTAGADED